MSDVDLLNVGQSIGKRLRALREQKNYSPTEIAAQLRLDPRVINAIENDDFDRLPDPIFVRGYIRGYCKVLGHNADELIALYENGDVSFEPEIIPEIKYPAQTNSNDKPVRAFTYLISLSLAVLLIAWWQSRFIVETRQQPVIQIPATNPEEPDLNIDSGTETSHPLYTGTVFIPEDSGDTADNAEAVPEADIDDMDAVSNGLLDIMQTDPTVESELAPDLMVANEINGPDTVVFELSADSWVEVTDANDERIFLGLARTGEILTISGTAPFNILLGFSQGVNVEFNGEDFDQSPFSRSGIARFTLGE